MSQFSQGQKLADLLKVKGKFSVESRLVHKFFVHIPLLSGARCVRVATWRCFSAFTAKTVKTYQLFLNRTDLMKSLSVLHYQCKSQTYFMKILSNIINFIVLTYFKMLALVSIELRWAISELNYINFRQLSKNIREFNWNNHS